MSKLEHLVGVVSSGNKFIIKLLTYIVQNNSIIVSLPHDNDRIQKKQRNIELLSLSDLEMVKYAIKLHYCVS